MPKQDAIKPSVEKYSKDGPFSDPVVRCDGCHTLVQTKKLQSIGCCPKCGNTRVRNVKTISGEEWKELQDWGIDTDFLALFADAESGKRGDDF